MHPTLKFATLPLAALSLGCNDASTEAARGGDVTIAVQQALTGQTTSAGSFQMSGAFTDAGATTEELTFGGPLTQSPVPVTFVRRMTGTDGVIVLRGSATLTFSSQTAATLTGSWAVESASGTYANYAGSGTLTGSANFGATPPTATLSYRGSLQR